MYYEKFYVQYNNLVFDGYDMISDFDAELSFKGGSSEYSYGDGAYAPYKNKRMFIASRSVDMTITLKVNRLPCEYRQYYVRYAEEELTKPGRLWAVKNNELIWAWAYPNNMSQVISHRQNEVVYDVEFTLPEGVWHKADKQKTFLLPYNVCVFMECKGYKEYDPCAEIPLGDCCAACDENKAKKTEDENCFCCCVDEITADMALCYHKNDLQGYYSCEAPYQIVYDCAHADKFNPNDHFGQKICESDGCEMSVIAGRFYSDTDLSTDGVTLVLTGKMKSPWITINGNTNIIQGEYDGTLTIKPNGDVYYSGNSCCDGELLDPSVWIVPKGMRYGWTIEPRNNSIIINLNDCCGGERACVYIQLDNITT